LREVEGPEQVVCLPVLRGRIERRERGRAEDTLDEARDACSATSLST
jgi:hypothetical protein